MSLKLKLCSIILSLILVISVFTGCGDKPPAAEPTNENDPTAIPEGTNEDNNPIVEPDTSEFVELIMYLFGEPAVDLDLVLGEVNKKLKEDLNCSLKINYIPWTDYQTKYSLLLASGEPIDLIYTAVWTPFNEHVQKGAYLPLDDLLPIYAPESYSNYSDLDWIEAGYDGKIYALPSYVVKLLPEGVLYRDDLRKKYNLEPINSIETFEAYLAAIKANEPNIIPYHASTTLEEVALLGLFNLKYGFTNGPDVFSKILTYKNGNDQENMRDLKILADQPEFADFLGTMREWYNKGYWSKSVLSNTIDSMDSFEQGKSGVAFCHIDRAKGISDNILATSPEWEPKTWFPQENTGIIHPAAVMQDAMALPRTCRYPERALMMLEKLRYDREYYDLVSYGILGKHYVLTEDGKIGLPEGMNASENPYPIEAMGSWGWRNYKLQRISAAPNQWLEYYDILDRLEIIATKNKFNAFQPLLDPIRAEIAAVEQLNQQYLYPLLFGVLDPVDGLKEYQDQLRTAGIDKIQEEVLKQVKDFADKMGF